MILNFSSHNRVTLRTNSIFVGGGCIDTYPLLVTEESLCEGISWADKDSRSKEI